MGPPLFLSLRSCVKYHGMMDIFEQKKLVRAQAYDRRAVLHAQGGGAAEKAAGFVLEFVSGEVVSAYLPIRSEIDPRPAMLALHDSGHQICVPVIQDAGMPLRFREWTPGCVLEAGPFGASVPAEGEWLEPDVLLVPLLAFDGKLFRLGYGGGYYDRTLVALTAVRSVVAAGFAYAGQRVNEVPINEFDQRLDAVITEDGVFDS